MKSLRDFSIRAKVLLPPVILALGMIVMGTFTNAGLNQFISTIDTISTEILGRISLIDEIVILSEHLRTTSRF